MRVVTVTPEIVDLHQEQMEIQIELDSTPLCFHYPLGALRHICSRCSLHDRADAIDRAIGRLLNGVAR